MTRTGHIQTRSTRRSWSSRAGLAHRTRWQLNSLLGAACSHPGARPRRTTPAALAFTGRSAIHRHGEHLRNLTGNIGHVNGLALEQVLESDGEVDADEGVHEHIQLERPDR